MRTREHAARLTVVSAVLALFCASIQPAVASTNDPFWSRQWGVQDVGAEFAWNASRGANVIIAVVDSGADYNHPDLKGKLLPGYDCKTKQENITVQDQNGHGTLVSGISAAVTNNSEGIASVAPDAKILPVRCFDSDGNATAQAVTEGIQWATSHHGNSPLVLNLSFVQSSNTGPLPDLFSDPGVGNAIKQAAASGVAVLIASGNDGNGTTAYDATVDGVAVVGASDQNDHRASLSNYGSGLDLLAPGLDIVSTYFDPAQGRSVYATADGTSASVPFVAGAAALLMSKGMNNKDAISKILSTAKDVGAPGRDNDSGFGILDVAAALGQPRSAPTQPASSPAAKTSPVASPRPILAASPQPSAIALPSPGTPPPFTLPSTNPSQITAPKVTASAGADEPTSLDETMRATAGLLILLVGAMHVWRRQMFGRG